MTRELHVNFSNSAYTITEPGESPSPYNQDWEPLPPAESVFVFAAPEERRLVRGRRNISWYTLRARIRDIDLARMLAAYLSAAEVAPEAAIRQVHHDGASTNVVFPMDEVQYSPAYLALGQNVYRLTHVELQDRPSSALRTVRRNVRAQVEGSRQQAEAILNSANLRARSTITDAERRASQMASNVFQLERTIAQTQGVYFSAHPADSGLTVVNVPLRLPVNTFAYGEKVWDAREMDIEAWPLFMAGFAIMNSTKLVVWSRSRVRNISNSGQHPHMRQTSACVGPGQEVFLDYSGERQLLESVRHAVSALQRTLTRVNLSSILVSIDDWAPAYRDAFPDELSPLAGLSHQGQITRIIDSLGGYRTETTPTAWSVASTRRGN